VFARFNLFAILTRIEKKVDHIMSSTDPLAPAIATLSTDVGTLQTQNAAIIALCVKLAAAANVNTAADLALIQAADTGVMGVTAADVAEIAAATPPASS